MARKREEKASQNSSNNDKKSRSKSTSPGKEKTFISLKHQLLAMKLTLREIPGDGNCLFGALADQLDGIAKTHQKHRQDVVSYMRHHREDFEPFVEDDIPFERHLGNLAELGTYGGNECIVAFARLNNVKVVIHQLNTPLWQIHGSEGDENIRELHISYHNGDHYNSVRRTGDLSFHPTSIKLMVKESSVGDGNKKGKPYKEYSTYYYTDDTDPGYSADEMVACADESSNINYVIEKTGCDDVQFIRKILENYDYNTDETICYISNCLHESRGEESNTVHTLWSPDGTGTRIFGHENEVSQATSQRKNSHTNLQEKLKNSSHLSNSRRKELKKQLRKQQNLERKKNSNKGIENYCPDSDESGETTIVKDLGCLSI